MGEAVIIDGNALGLAVLYIDRNQLMAAFEKIAHSVLDEIALAPMTRMH